MISKVVQKIMAVTKAVQINNNEQMAVKMARKNKENNNNKVLKACSANMKYQVLKNEQIKRSVKK